MKLIGLTGGIASGKSAVSRMLRDAGVDVVDADVLAREAVEPGTEGLREIVEEFGTGVLREDGALDRAALGAIVFSNEEPRRKLNAILHPKIAALAAEKTSALEARGVDVCVYEAPLLFENGLDRAMDATILVAVPEDVQRARLMARDGLDAAQAEARIRAQMPLEEKRRRATVVLDNAGSLEETAAQLRSAWQRLTGRALELPPQA